MPLSPRTVCPLCSPCLRQPLRTSPLASQVFDQVVVQPRDAREASDVFYRQVSRAALRYVALCCAVLSCVLLDASRPVWPAITP